MRFTDPRERFSSRPPNIFSANPTNPGACLRLRKDAFCRSATIRSIMWSTG